MVGAVMPTPPLCLLLSSPRGYTSSEGKHFSGERQQFLAHVSMEERQDFSEACATRPRRRLLLLRGARVKKVRLYSFQKKARIIGSLYCLKDVKLLRDSTPIGRIITHLLEGITSAQTPRVEPPRRACTDLSDVNYSANPSRPESQDWNRVAQMERGLELSAPTF